jgi:hypothetical protein
MTIRGVTSLELIPYIIKSDLVTLLQYFGKVKKAFLSAIEGTWGS